MSVNIDSDQCLQHSEALVLKENFPVNHAVATLILAHGAGAAMDSAFMNAIVERLVSRNIAVIRFEFPYMSASRRDGIRRPPNPQAVLLACWRQVFATVRSSRSGTVVMGGKSMGGRMASLLADELRADALICLGYPSYAAGKQDNPRVGHLQALQAPTLIVQGDRDAMGNRPAVEAYALSKSIDLLWLKAADHDLRPLKKSGFTVEQHLDVAADAIADFLRQLDRL